MSDLDRDDIHDLLVRAPAPDLHYDLGRTLRQGRRIRTRRRLAALGGGLATTCAVAVAFAGLGPVPGDDARPAGFSDRTSAEILDYRFAVEVAPSGVREATVTTYSVDAGKRTRIDRWTTAPGVVSLAPGSAADGVLLGVAPARAKTFTLVTDSDTVPAFPDARPLVGTDYQALAFHLPDGSRAAAPFDVIWTDDTGAFDTAGQPLPSTLDATTEEMLVLDPQRRLIMSQRPDGSSRSDYPAGSTPWAGDRYDTRSAGIQVLGATFVIPTRGSPAEDITVRWSNGTSTNATVVGNQGAEWTFLRAERKPSPKVETGELHPTAVEWTDSSGTRQTEPVKRPVP